MYNAPVSYFTYILFPKAVRIIGVTLHVCGKHLIYSIIAQAYHLNPGNADLVDTSLIQHLIFNKSWSPVAEEISNLYIHLLSLTEWEGIDSGVHG